MSPEELGSRAAALSAAIVSSFSCQTLIKHLLHFCSHLKSQGKFGISNYCLFTNPGTWGRGLLCKSVHSWERELGPPKELVRE